MAFINPQSILDATNGGLEIILNLFPQASGCETNKNKKFKLRDSEKTPSCSLKQNTADGNWLVTDFGGDSQPRNAISLYAHEKGLDWPTALQELAASYNILGEEQAKQVFRPDYEERPATPEENEGDWMFELRDSFTDLDIQTIISKNILRYLNWKSSDEGKAKAAYSKIAAAFKEYRWHSIISYSIIKNRSVKTFKSTENYPIFLIDEGTHKKIYQPLNPDKKYRFMYYGKKPSVFIHGLEQLQNAYNENKKRIEDDEQEDLIEDTGSEGEPIQKSKKSKNDPRLQEAILVSGGSDGINVALLGYRVIWMNSESAKLYQTDYDKIASCVLKFYNLPDLDLTGKRQAHILAMQYLELFTIELPDELLKRKDRRNNACKDVRDYFNHYYRKDFKALIEAALPYRFWEKKAKYEGRGENKVFAGFDYEFDNVQAYNFLAKNGFYRMRSGDKKTDWIFIRINGNTVSEVDPNDIKNFVHEFLKERLYDKNLRNSMFRTNQLSEGSLSNLDVTDIEFKDFDKESQMIFFTNKTIRVTKEGVEEFKPGDIACYSWEEEVRQHHYEKPKEEPFIITKDELGTFDIEVKNKSCLFLQYLVQTSRIHWRDELEGERFQKLSEIDQEKYALENHINIAGHLLTPEQIEEQKRHLVNKLYCMGYLMHRYKDRSKAWFIYAMDAKESTDGQSHGGSGKSIMFDMAMRHLLGRTFQLPGRSPKLAEDAHKYDGLTEHDRYILIDDAHEYLRLDVFYTDVTGDMKVNPKGKKPYIIPFEKSGKLAVTTNYSPKNNGPSTERRTLYTAFSDYYHNKGETTDYLESRDPKTDLGKSLFTEFTRTEWNDFFNTAIYALKFFLSVDEKVTPGMGNVNRRNLLNTMGVAFHDWAIAYFAEESEKRDTLLVREYIYKDFTNANPGKWTAQTFMKRMQAFCKYHGFILNPKELHNTKEHKIIHKAEEKYYDHRDNVWRTVQGEKKTKEMLYIQTLDHVVGHEPEGFTPEVLSGTELI
jgi:hypothetical protein